MSPELQIQLLGEFRVLYGEEAVTGLNTPRLQALLAYLVLHREAPQARSHLSFLFWPDSTESQARTNLRKQIYHLRRVLPEAERYLYADSQVVHWQPSTAFGLDVDEFETTLARAAQEQRRADAWAPAAIRKELERAVTLYGGDLLPSHYEDWVLSERERLHQAFIQAMEQLTLLLESQRDYAAGIAHALRLLRHDPLHEATYRRLMRLHALDGDRAGALRAYHTCATILERELGVEPSPATREAYERLLKIEAPPTPSRTRLASTSPLVGRAQEWTQLQMAWRTASKGKPQLVLLTGEAGIGKTRLAEELLEWTSRQGIATAETRCYSSERGLAYAPVAAWLRSPPLRQALAELEELWLSEVTRLLPEILVERPEVPPPTPLTEHWQQQRMFDALVQPFLATRKLVLLLDDLQWCDGETLEWLPHLMRPRTPARGPEPGEAQLLVIATMRREEMPADRQWASLELDLRREGQLTQIELGPLNEEEAALLAASVAGHEVEASLATELYGETEGNPLFVIETVRSGWLRTTQEQGVSRLEPRVERTLPRAVQAAISARLAQLSPAARELVGAAATIGRAFTYDVLARACKCDEDSLVQGLDELWQRRLVREQGTDAYDFSHDKIREVAHAELSAARRKLLHRRVALAIQEVHAQDLDAVAGRIAAHFEQGDLPEAAVPYYRRSAAAAQRLYANEEAIETYQHLLDSDLAQAMKAAERCAVMLDLGRVWQLTGRWAEAEAILREALAQAETLADRRLRAQSQQALGYVLRLQGAYTEALRWLERAGDNFVEAEDRQGLVRVFWTMAEIHWYLGDNAQALAALETQSRIADEIGDQRGTCDALGTMGIVYWSQGDFSQSKECCERSIEIAERIGYPWAAGRALITLGNVDSSMGHHPQALDWYRQALEIGNQIGDRQCVEWAVANIGNVYGIRGDADPALACYRYGLQLSLEVGDTWSAGIALANMAETFEKQGELAQAEKLYQRAIALGRALQANYLNSYLVSLAGLYAGQERYEEARALVDEALRATSQAFDERMGGEAILFRARALKVRLGRVQGQVDPLAAKEELEEMLGGCEDREQQAMLHYELWRLDPDQETHHQRATDLYRSLYDETSSLAYRRRYQELSGEALPPPSPLPDPPEMVGTSQVDIDSLLVLVDRMVDKTRLDSV